MALALGCATGSSDTGGNQQPADASSSEPDATQAVPDAQIPADAAVAVDAPPVVVVDAPPMMTPDAPSSGLFCTANNQCTTAGECCITLGGPMGFCGPGTVIFGECFPFN